VLTADVSNQDYENFLLARDYRSAFLLGLSLSQPRRLHTLFALVASSPDRQPASLTGHTSLDDAIARLEGPSVLALLRMIRDWNATTRTADVAQTVLHAVLKLHPPAELLSLTTEGRKTNELGELLDALLPYTERHFARADRLLAQDSFSLDYLLTQCDVFDEDEPSAGRMEGIEVVGR
jgi:U3 small nucleolar RNA-associated protein 13